MQSLLQRSLFVATTALALVTSSPARATDIFLNLGTEIPGESKDQAHAGQIDVLSWSWGVSNPANRQAGGGASAGKANFRN